MMSVVVSEEATTGELYVFSKGADIAILPLIADKESEAYRNTCEQVERFAEQGMRTLVFAYKRLQLDTDFNSNEIEDFDDDFFEQNLSLLGVTGVEDMLQDEVQKCVKDFQDAGICTWIVTGDKNSTAKCIGYTSNVFSRDKSIIQIDTLEEITEEVFNELAKGQSDLLVSGQTICQIIEKGNRAEYKLQIGAIIDCLLIIKGLVVYRASPSEKAELVKLVRKNKP